MKSPTTRKLCLGTHRDVPNHDHSAIANSSLATHLCRSRQYFNFSANMKLFTLQYPTHKRPAGPQTVSCNPHSRTQRTAPSPPRTSGRYVRVPPFLVSRGVQCTHGRWRACSTGCPGARRACGSRCKSRARPGARDSWGPGDRGFLDQARKTEVTT